MANTGQLEVNMLFLGLTRPSMLLGVSYLVVLANFFICLMLFVMTSKFQVFVGMIVIHAVAYILSEKEPLFLELFMIKQQKCNKCKNRLYHGLTNSYDVM